MGNFVISQRKIFAWFEIAAVIVGEYFVPLFVAQLTDSSGPLTDSTGRFPESVRI
jgi:hypothetical protein